MDKNARPPGERGTKAGHARKKRPLVVAHRGSPLEYLENTKESFQRAMNLQVDMIELDIQEIATGEVVVFHDEDLQRLAHSPRQIRDLTLDELNGIEIQSFKNRRLKKGKIPLFSDVLEMLDHRTDLDVEIKGLDIRKTNLVVQAVHLVETLNLENRILFSSFNFMALFYVHRMNRLIRTGFLTDYPDFYFAVEAFIPKRYRPDALIFYSKRTDERLIRRALRDYTVMVFTVDDPDEMRKFAAWGVDGIITNRPGFLKSLLDERQGF